MRRFIAESRSIPLLFALLIILAYGLLLPFTGFYWDDWPFAWIAKFLGPSEFIPAFTSFRPFLGPIFALTTRLIPPVPVYWQILALVVRFLLVLSAWWLIRSLWPDHPRTALGASLLLLVFPGYSQHWVAFTHINQELIPLIMYVLSFGFTVRAIKLGEGAVVNHESKGSSKQTRPYLSTLIALLLQAGGLFPTEYFFGLELLRPLFIFIIFSTPGFWQRAWQSFRYWLPYLVIWILNALWLLYYYNSGLYSSYETSGIQAPALPLLFVGLLDAIWKAGIYIWVQILVLLSQSIAAPSSLLTIGLILFSLFLLINYLSKLHLSDTSERSIALQLLLLGLAGILVGRLPSLAAGLPLRLQSSYDRFMVSMFLGGCLVMQGILELVATNVRIRNVLLSILIALGIGQQFFNANIFRRDWENQGQIYWQMTWRMPALQSHTVLLTHQMPIDYETDLSFTGPVNWMYAPDYSGGILPYALLYTEKRLGGPTLPTLETGLEIHFPYRTVDFHGNTSAAVVIYMPPTGCLRVLDPALEDDQIYEKESPFLVRAIPLSDPDRIIPDPISPAKPMFFKEPAHAWCFYYTHAELARQFGKWDAVVALWNEAKSSGYIPGDSIEYLPFMEAAVRTSNWNMAGDLIQVAISEESSNRKSLCLFWNRLLAQAAQDNLDKSRILGSLNDLGCSS